jgi:hypothetical protein
MDQHPDTWTSEGSRGGSNWSTPRGTPPSLVAPKADPPWDPPRIIKVPSPEAMSHELPLDGGRQSSRVSGTLRQIEGLEFV